jgi:hypothetical protein
MSFATTDTTGKLSIYDIPRHPGDSEMPKEIVYCQLSASTDNGEFSVYMPRQNWVFHGLDINVFIDKLLNPEIDRHLTSNHIYGPTHKTKTCCDITIKDVCYIVLQLTGFTNWQFSSSAPAVQMGYPCDDKDAPENWGLIHVAPDGRHCEHPVDNCQIAYFRVARRDANSSRPFNFNVELKNNDYPQAIALIIDPDTNNNGTIPAKPE